MKRAWLVVAVVLLCCSFAPADWIPVRNVPGRFKILFPRQPEQTKDTVNTAIGPLTLNIFMYEVGKFKDDNAVYGMIYSDYPDTLVNSDFKDEILDTFFKHAVAGSAANIKGKVITEDRISFKSYPGRNVKVSFMDGQGMMHMRMYLVKSRVYILEVGCETQKDNNASITRFFNSFDLLENK